MISLAWGGVCYSSRKPCLDAIVDKLNGLVPPLLTLCHQAGEVIAAHYHAPGANQYEAKGDNSPLTRADLDSHVVLSQGLPELGACWPVLSEESGDITPSQRLSWPCYWLVDPLDGTKEFLARTGEFTINIALIKDHRPVLGVLYQPLLKLAHVGIPNTGAWSYQRHSDNSWQEAQLSCSSLDEARPLRVLASRRHGGDRLGQCIEWLQQQWQATERINSGSALKFCQLVEGAGDFYPRYSPCCEWDVAAGQALVEAAGGCVLGLDGQPLRYNLRESILSPNFYALADPEHRLWRELLNLGL
jgi:3'(2'), 5'-bisphosphate nucleotidase